MPRVSLSTVIVAHDSRQELELGLPALLEQLGDDDELIIVDNDSSDDPGGVLERIAPEARLITLPCNIGFAAGANRGADAAHGELLVLLNPDTVVQPGWAEAIREPWNGPWAAWMGLVLLDGGDIINTSGNIAHFAGFGWAGQLGEPLQAAPRGPTEAGYLSGACLAIPRATWIGTGGFSEHYFMYSEDLDLSLRLRLGGGQLAVIPGAKVIHSYEFSKGHYKWRLLERNRWATMVRAYPTLLLALVAPALLLTEVAVWAVALRSGWARAKVAATLDVLRALPTLARERRAIQAGRKISARKFACSLTAELSSPYFGPIGRNPVIQRALKLYWQAVCAALPRGRERARLSQP